MLTHDEIVNAVKKTVVSYPIRTVAYFGSYADGNQTEDSDLDLLVEFVRPISLTTIIDFQLDMEDELNVAVDVVSFPVVEGAIIEIEKVVQVYGQKRQDFA